jgi:hypothetical protein
MGTNIQEFLERMASEVQPSPVLSQRLVRKARRRRARTIVVGLLTVSLVTAGALYSVRALRAQNTPVPLGPASCSWTVVPSPNLDPSTRFNWLRDVAVVSDQDVWAAGIAYIPEGGGGTRSLLLHWDGTAWSIVPHPAGEADGDLQAVAVSAANDAWAVGYDGNSGLIEHWDGSTWSVVPAEDPGARYWHFFDVVAVTEEDVWAVGNTATGTSGGTLIEHWDGERWSVVPSPSPEPRPLTSNPYASLLSIAARSADDVWAVGQSENVGGNGPSNTLVLHWDGAAWNVVASSDGDGFQEAPYDRLLSVAAAPGLKDVWAVGLAGSKGGFGGKSDRALALYFDGTSWTRTSVPGVWFSSVVSTGPDEALAFGSYSGHAVVERWDGTSWQVEEIPVRGTADLSAGAQAPSGTVWAVGSVTDAGTQETLVLRCA